MLYLKKTTGEEIPACGINDIAILQHNADDCKFNLTNLQKHCIL